MPRVFVSGGAGKVIDLRAFAFHHRGMDYVFAYAAGLLTLINPCVLPVLPIVLVAALDAHRRGPLALAAGLSLSFVAVGVGVTAFGGAIGLTQDTLAQIGALAMVGFGLILLVPAFSRPFAAATAGVAAGADARMTALARRGAATGLQGQFLGGMLLGAVWSPCIGPTLGGAIALAAQGDSLGHVTGVVVAFAAGVSTFMIGIGRGAQGALRGAGLRALGVRARPLLGAAFLILGGLLYFQLHHLAEVWLLDVMPSWLVDMSVAL